MWKKIIDKNDRLWWVKKSDENRFISVEKVASKWYVVQGIAGKAWTTVGLPTISKSVAIKRANQWMRKHPMK